MVKFGLAEVDVHPIALERLAPIIGPDRTSRFESTAATARDLLRGRRVVQVNSTASGGGVAELLQTLLAYARGAEVDARWLVIEGDAAFFDITKRIHNHLYGSPGDGGPLGSAEHRHYETTTARNAEMLTAYLRSGDIVVLHDPQTAGLARHLLHRGVHVVWRCHVGINVQNEHSDHGWAFLRRYVEDAAAYVFSRTQFAPQWMPSTRLAIIPPSIDPFSAKNALIEPDAVRDLLQFVGLITNGGTDRATPFRRRDGSVGTICRQVDLVGTGPAPPAEVPIVLQVSRWDLMKDMQGVMRSFAVSIAPHADAHLILAGPETDGVTDDPEGGSVLRDCLETWAHLPEAIRARVHLACVPMTDGDEAASIVNALQRHARVVTQKSIAEGFGLTVAEAMWKSRPVIGSAVGGIIDQIIDGETGWLVEPADSEQFGRAACSLLEDVVTADRMGAAGHDRTITHFLGDRHLEQWVDLFMTLD